MQRKTRGKAVTVNFHALVNEIKLPVGVGKPGGLLHQVTAVWDTGATNTVISKKVVGVLGLALLGFLSLACSLILDAVARGRREIRRLHYLALPCLPVRRNGQPASDLRSGREAAERDARGPGDDG